MGKKNKPFVSVCTPTFNRRPFLPFIAQCFLKQDYPMNRMEWVIVDDGTDSIESQVKELKIPQIKYVRLEEKHTLGNKRNIMHSHTKGDIIVYMDDDDYYPPERVSHAVEMLTKHPKALCAGSSAMFTWFKHINKMVQFGPYGPNHATAGTFAFKRKLLLETAYDPSASLGEEKHFLKNYTIPFVQLDPKKVILVFSHSHNTFDKKKLLETPSKYVNFVDYKVDDFITDPTLREFYLNIDLAIQDYSHGSIDMKPDVIDGIKKLEEERKKCRFHLTVNTPSGPVLLYDNDIAAYMNKLLEEVHVLKRVIELQNEKLSLAKLPRIEKDG
jgi:glycosyltransferase involved in cell wall biosynthesis